ncbi:Ger(x)C family spore germination protein [Fictibacillus iocasae]|uniref:Ger(X)C family spore germination protein n=1 Tax=Fictibacillus iocasae TaxID=2715437 RepID=A0ABW2NUI4_9BACL
MAHLKKITTILLCLLLLSGCWDQSELPDFGFVQSIAIEHEKGRYKLTTQFYKPSAKISSSGGGSNVSFMNITTEGDSVFEAVRDITSHLGRKANWGHMRFILIDEKTAKKMPMNEILEFFYRDHEPRLLTGIAITKGKAPGYLKTKPHVENTISQQLNEITKSASEFSGKTYPANLFTIGKQLLSEVDIAYLPYIKVEKAAKDSIVVAGLSVLKHGKLKKIYSPQDTKYLMIGLGELNGAIIEVPCGGKRKGESESYEVVSSSTKWNLQQNGETITYDGSVKMKASMGELKCTFVQESKQLDEVNKRVASVVEKELWKLLKQTQKDRLDLLGVGNEMYRRDPKQWMIFKKDWDQRYTKVRFKIHADVNIINTGTDPGKPFKKGQ